MWHWHSKNAKQGSQPRQKPFFSPTPPDFSLVLGGPIFQLFRRSRLSGDGLELLHRRLLAITLFAWLPMLTFANLDSSSGSRLSFFHDVEVHVRFLIALPILIGAELIVHSLLRRVVYRFVERHIFLSDDLVPFNRAIESAITSRNSILVESALLFVVYTLGLCLWNSRIAVTSATWYAQPGGRWFLTPVGFWYVFASIPILLLTVFFPEELFMRVIKVVFWDCSRGYWMRWGVVLWLALMLFFYGAGVLG